MPPIMGENTNMKAILTVLITSARCAAISSRWVTQATNTITSTATGTISEISPSQTAVLLAKSE